MTTYGIPVVRGDQVGRLVESATRLELEGDGITLPTPLPGYQTSGSDVFANVSWCGPDPEALMDVFTAPHEWVLVADLAEPGEASAP